MINSGKNIKASFGLIPPVCGWAPDYSIIVSLLGTMYFTYNSAAYGPLCEKTFMVFDSAINTVLIRIINELRWAEWWIWVDDELRVVQERMRRALE